jgi:methylglutaconyl-CoA hydratase
MSYEFLTTRRVESVEYVTLNRPEVRNALSERVLEELASWAEHCRRAVEQHNVRVLVMSGAGKAFCAGADITWMAKTVEFTEEENIRDAKAMSRTFALLNELPAPLIGRVHGAALGGGSGLAAVCDIVVAEEAAVFGFTEVKLGRSAARELFLTGARFTAGRAKEIGLIHSVVPMSQLDATVDGYVREILTAGPEAVATAKSLIGQVWNKGFDEATSLTARTIALRRVSAEGQEGLGAFLEKRKPSWSQ